MLHRANAIMTICQLIVISVLTPFQSCTIATLHNNFCLKQVGKCGYLEDKIKRRQKIESNDYGAKQHGLQKARGCVNKKL